MRHCGPAHCFSLRHSRPGNRAAYTRGAGHVRLVDRGRRVWVELPFFLRWDESGVEGWDGETGCAAGDPGGRGVSMVAAGSLWEGVPRSSTCLIAMLDRGILLDWGGGRCEEWIASRPPTYFIGASLSSPSVAGASPAERPRAAGASGQLAQKRMLVPSWLSRRRSVNPTTSSSKATPGPWTPTTRSKHVPVAKPFHTEVSHIRVNPTKDRQSNSSGSGHAESGQVDDIKSNRPDSW